MKITVLLGAAFMFASSLSVAAAEVPPVRATYHSERESLDDDGAPAKRVVDWQFERDVNYVAITSPSDRRSEEWVRDSGGRVWYSRVFHTERKVIEYQPTDLGLGGISNSWDQIRSIVDPKQLEVLERTGSARDVAGHRATVYRGKTRDVEIELWWIDQLQVPALVRKKSRRETSTLRLIDVAAMSANERRPKPADYELIDFSDLGDRHHDPFVERLMKYDGLWFGH